MQGKDVSPACAVAAHLKARRAASALADLHWRYDLGSAAHSLRYARATEYGPDGVEILASALNMNPATIRRYARVAETISQAEFSEHMELADQSGMPLSWCHLEELAKCRNKTLRRQCAKDAVASELSVSELALRVRAVTKA
jgi:hypothetical protein